MEKIDDVVAFALANPDYLTDFLNQGAWPDELSPDEQKALGAVRDHVSKAVALLLGGAANAFAKAIGGGMTNHHEGPLVSNRAANAKTPSGKGSYLYRVDVRLVLMPKAQLVPSLLCKKERQDEVLAKLTTAGVTFSQNSYRVSGTGIELVEGQLFTDIFTKVANVGKALFACVP